MAKTSTAQRAVDLVTLFQAKGKTVQGIKVDGKSIEIWFEKKDDDEVNELDYVDWKFT
jgi:hypothetical protein